MTEEISMEIIKFIISIIILCLLPGYGLTFLLNFPLFSKERLVSGFSVGLIFFTLISAVLYYLKLKLLIIPFFLALDIIFLLKLWQEFSLNTPRIFINFKIIFCLSLIIILGTLSFVSIYFRNGLPVKEEGMLTYTQIDQDAYWHLSIQNEIQKKFPPEHPGFSGSTLKNYHYLVDLFISSLVNSFKLDNLNVFFRFIPVLFCVLFGMSVYTLAYLISRQNILAVFSTAFAYFSGNASYLLILLNKDSKGWGQNSFMLDQPFMLLSNLHTFAAVIIILTSLIIFFSSKYKTKFIYMAILIGVSAGFKIYPAIVVIASFGFVSILRFLKEKKADIFILTILSGIIFLLVTLPNKGEKSGMPFFWAPGWLLSNMASDPDRVYLPRLVLKEITYREHHNFLRILQIRLIEVVIYFLGNLYVRIIGFIFALLEIFRKKTNMVILILGISSLFSLLFPLLLGQNILIYNILQFGSLAIIFTSILTPLVFYKLKIRLNKIIFLFIIFVLSVPISTKNFVTAIQTTPSVILPARMEIINLLKKDIRDYDILLLYPSSVEKSNFMINALSGIQVFYSGEDYTEFTGQPVKERKVEIAKFFFPENKIKGTAYQTSFILKHHIKSLYVKKEDAKFIKNIYIPKKLIFQNIDGVLYRFL